MMIILNNKKFAANDSEFKDSLFTHGGTCVGYYKVNKVSIALYNHNKEKIGVINKHEVLCKATKTNGGYWYSYGDIKEVGAFKSYIDQVNNIREICDKYLPARDIRGYSFT